MKFRDWNVFFFFLVLVLWPSIAKNAKKKKKKSEENPPGIAGDPGRVPMTKNQLPSVIELLFLTDVKKQPGD